MSKVPSVLLKIRAFNLSTLHLLRMTPTYRSCEQEMNIQLEKNTIQHLKMFQPVLSP